MLTDEELRFVEKELRKNGVQFESVQNVLDTDPRVIYDLCNNIQTEECELSGGWGRDENGNEYEYEAKEGYNPARWNMAEDIYVVLMKRFMETFNQKKRKHGSHNLTMRDMYNTCGGNGWITHFLPDHGYDFVIYWTPEPPLEYANTEVYLGVHEKSFGETVKKYFHPDTRIEEMDKLFNTTGISSVLMKDA